MRPPQHVHLRRFEPMLEDAGKLPPSTRRMATYCSRIARAASAWWYAGGSRRCALRCRRRPDRRPCPGHLRVEVFDFDGAPDTILWSCERCGDSGAITGWRDGPWDLSRAGATPPRSNEAYETPPGSGWIETALVESAYRAIDSEALGGPASQRVFWAALVKGPTVLLGGPRTDFTRLLHAVLQQAHRARPGRRRSRLEGAAILLAHALE